MSIFCTESVLIGKDAQGHRIVKCKFIADSASDLPAYNAYVTETNELLSMGSEADTVNDGAQYKLNSSGSWILTQPGQAAYTKAEIDLMIDAINQLNADQQAQINYSINTGSKNKLKTLRASGTSATGLIYTLNSNGTYTLGGTTTADANITAICTLADLPAEFVGKNVILSGAVDASIRLCVYNGNVQTTYIDTGAGTEFEVSAEMISNPYTVRLLVRSGTDCSGKILKPMVRLASITDSSFYPYAPTNREIYEILNA